MIQVGKRGVFAMGQAVPIRTDYTANKVRRFAKCAKDGAQARRLLALAAVLGGGLRGEAAKVRGEGCPTICVLGNPVYKPRAGGILYHSSPGAQPTQIRVGSRS